MGIFADMGLWGMFGVAFLAATVLPLGSEVVLVALLIQGAGPEKVIAAATAGNVLGALVNYGIGMAGSQWLLKTVAKTSAREMEKALDRFRRWGTASLVLAWVPVIGDPLTLAAGMLRVNLALFLFLVTLGKLGRYLVLGGLALGW